MIIGKSLIGNIFSEEEASFVKAFSPIKGEEFTEHFYSVSQKELHEIEKKAERAYLEYSNTSCEKRAHFLETIADEIMALGDELLERTHLETGLPMARMQGERGRTVNQLRYFANIVRKGEYQENVIDNGDPERSPLPKPDIRRKMIGIGPVLVFGASNFPFAFSTAGGDTASALAGGNPVILKAHNSHLGTNDLVSQAIINAVKKTGMPDGTFSMFIDSSLEATGKMIVSPVVKAIAFTGSIKAGRAIFNKAGTREDTIPVFAEMGSINPVLVTAGSLENKTDEVAELLSGSISLGCGQFCTNPGLIFLEGSEKTEEFIQKLASSLSATNVQSMLNKGIFNSYCETIKDLSEDPTVKSLIENKKNTDSSKLEVSPSLFLTDSEKFINNKNLQEEVFGPSSLIVKCKNKEDMIGAIQSLEGQLTASLFAEESEIAANRQLLDTLITKVGRVIYNQVPTGVEVCASMQHGGPYPASTDARFSSVGGNAIMRFLRPIAFQNFPQNLLPEEIKDENPKKMIRLVDQDWIR